jgi:uncharacterized iron-regulated membrane protein
MKTVALTRESKMNWWQQWLELPHKPRLHNAVFQIHFWIGAIAAMYLAFMSLTGSIIVYRNELSRWTSVDWIVKLHSLLLSSPFASSFISIRFFFILLWGVSGIYFAFPDSFL